jgi:integrase
MLDLIERQPALGDFIFGHDGNGPVGWFARLKRQVDGIAKIEVPWSMHDLRRTRASGMLRIGVRAEAVERALNHVSGSFRGIAGIYQHDPLSAEVRDALARWGAHVDRIVKGEEPGKVVQLRS